MEVDRKREAKHGLCKGRWYQTDQMCPNRSKVSQHVCLVQHAEHSQPVLRHRDNTFSPKGRELGADLNLCKGNLPGRSREQEK